MLSLNAMESTLTDCVFQWKKKLDKTQDDDVTLKIIRKLSKISITPEILEATHIGKKIRTLSKRNDIVGEKAKDVLKKWRDIFTSFQSARKPEPSNVGKKENASAGIKSSKHRAIEDKSIHHQKKASDDHKHKNKKYSMFNRLSQQSSKELNENCIVDDSIDSSHSHHMNTMKDKYSNCMDCHAEVSDNCKVPKSVLNDNEVMKALKSTPLGISEQSSLKRKLKVEKHTETKKLKTERFSSSHSESNQIQERNGKHNIHKSKSHSATSKGEMCPKINSKKDNSVKHESSSCVKETKSRKSRESNSAVSNKLKPLVKMNSSEQFTSSSVSFEDCLGLNDIVTLKKKKSSKPHTISKKLLSSPVSIESKPSGRISCNPPVQEISKKSPLNYIEKEIINHSKINTSDSALSVPEMEPYYISLPLDLYTSKKKVLTNEDAAKFISSRKEKTAVYSGRRNLLAGVPSLFDCCTRVLIENIDAIEYLGGIPYFLLKPVLEKGTPIQLFKIENFNPSLLESTNELWKIHCKRDYKLLSPHEHETWRELYLRAHDESERKLKNVTASISASISKSKPVRQVKMAFIDSVAKPPRDVARKQAKNGIACTVTSTKSTTITHLVKKPSSSVVQPVSEPSSKAISAIIKPSSPAGELVNGPSSKSVTSAVSSHSSNAVTSVAPKKPKVAPLMAKALKSMRQCYRRK